MLGRVAVLVFVATTRADNVAAGQFAAGSIIGQAAHNAAEPSPPPPSAAAVNNLESQAQAIIDPDSAFRLQSGLGSELRLVLNVTQDFLADFVPSLLWLTLIIVLALIITWAWIKVWGLLFWQCGIPENWRRLSQITWGALLIFFGFSLAFGAVGINFSHLFFGFSFVAAAIVVSASDVASDFFVGIRLQTLNLLTDHHLIYIPQYDLRGELIDVGILTSEVVLIVDDTSATAEMAKSRGYTSKTTLIPNRFILNGPLDVEWHDVRPSSRPPAYTSQAPPTLAHQQRLAVLESGDYRASGSGERTRFSAPPTHMSKAEQAQYALSHLASRRDTGSHMSSSDATTALKRRLVAAVRNAPSISNAIRGGGGGDTSSSSQSFEY